MTACTTSQLTLQPWASSLLASPAACSKVPHPASRPRFGLVRLSAALTDYSQVPSKTAMRP